VPFGAVVVGDLGTVVEDDFGGSVAGGVVVVVVLGVPLGAAGVRVGGMYFGAGTVDEVVVVAAGGLLYGTVACCLRRSFLFLSSSDVLFLLAIMHLATLSRTQTQSLQTGKPHTLQGFESRSAVERPW